MSRLEKAYFQLIQPENENKPMILDARINILVTILYLAILLSVPLGRLSSLIWFAIYPIIASAILGLSYSKIFLSSLIILPLLILIGLFNPILDSQVLFRIGSFEVTTGWISFIAILIRGLLAMQSVILMIKVNNFRRICFGLRKLGVPAFLTDQLLFIYRYLAVLLDEAITMRRAIESRGYGKKNFPLKLWGTFIGQLFLRSLDRADKINKAMLSRGFTGTMPPPLNSESHLRKFDIIYGIGCCVILIFLRIYNLSNLFFN